MDYIVASASGRFNFISARSTACEAGVTIARTGGGPLTFERVTARRLLKSESSMQDRSAAYLCSHRAYQVASFVEDTRESDFILYELDFTAPDLKQALCRFSKTTVLHFYIVKIILLYYPCDFRKNPEVYFPDDSDNPDEIESWLDDCGISRTKFAKFAKGSVPADDRLDLLGDWYLDQEGSFTKLWEAVTDEVFHFLFQNRRFLLKFNLAMSNYLRENPRLIPKSSRTNRGTIRRVRMPDWVKKAVYFGDRGRCLSCHVDLSHMLSIDRHQHYDHIVPLNKMGVNDPTNVQLLCADCNQQKSSASIGTSISYPTWW